MSSYWTRLRVNAAVRTLLQGVAAVAVTAAFLALRAYINNNASISWWTAGKVAIQAAVMAVLAYGIHLARGERPPVPDLHLDALVRTIRTLLAGLAVTVFVTVFEAAQSMVGSGTFNLSQIAQTVTTAAGMAALAWLHRVALDPSPLPSAAPPALPAELGDANKPAPPEMGRRW